MFRNAPPGWKVKSSKEIYSHNLIKIFEDTLDLDGEETIYIRAVRRNYSTIVPFISNNELLVIRCYRHLVDSVQVEAPSGYIEEGESPYQAAIRELKEETGYEARKVLPLGCYTLDYSMFEQEGNVFAAYDVVNDQERSYKQSLGRMEQIEVDIISISEIKQLLREGKILNAASIVAFHKALEFHELHITDN
ncbi:MAG TPA: NUDIX hydrolase [Nitrososphaeraceae archaeon]|nr:NUDIX hydrolase [Nitrososphaeraceae archaeon]